MSLSSTFHLQADELLPERLFTHPRHTFYDRRLLCYLISRLHALFAAGRLPEQEMGMATVVEREPDGRILRQVVVDPTTLAKTAFAPFVVGFFGQRRIDAADGPLQVGDDFLVQTLAEHEGLLSYSTIEMTCGNFANCVLFIDEGAKSFWGQHPIHARLAAELSPRYYHTVRIYNGRLPAGIAAADRLALTIVKYVDYRTSPFWRGERRLSHGK